MDIKADSAIADSRLLLVRHGRTRWNVERLRQGREDIPLDVAGLASAEALRHTVSCFRIDAIHSSRLRRAFDTARPVAIERGLAILTDDDLLELDFGSFGGTSRVEAKVRLRKDYLYKQLPGGESLADAWRRAEQFVSRITPDLVAGRNLLIVGHKRLNRLLLGQFEGQTLEQTAADNRYRPAPGSMIELRFSVEAEKLRLHSVEGMELAAVAD